MIVTAVYAIFQLKCFESLNIYSYQLKQSIINIATNLMQSITSVNNDFNDYFKATRHFYYLTISRCL